MPDAPAPVAPVTPVAPVVAKPPAAPPPAEGAKAVESAKSPAQKLDELFELEIKGEKKQMTRAEVIARAQKAEFAEKSISESRNAYKALQQRQLEIDAALTSAKQGDPAPLFKLLKAEQGQVAKDPKQQAALMKVLGIDPDAYARQLLTEKLTMEGMTPEQRRIAELEAKAAEAENKLKSVGEQRRQERVQQKAKMQQAALFKELTSAAERIGFTADEQSLGAIYQVMEEMHRDGIAWHPDFIVQEAKDRIDRGYKRLEEQTLKGLDGPKLAARLGPEVMKRLRSHLASDKEFIREIRAGLAAKLRAGQPLDAKPAEQPAPAAPPSNRPTYKSPSELDAEVREMGRRLGT